MASKKLRIKDSLNDLVKRFAKNDVIAEIERSYAASSIKEISLSLIDDNAFLRRAPMPNESTAKMAKSIMERGVFVPILVRPVGSHYELVLGRKRYAGAKAAGLEAVPTIVRNLGDEETLLMLLADARDQREGNIVEMALIYDELSKRFDYTQKTLASLAHQSRSQVNNTLRLLKLPEKIIRRVSRGELSYGHARALLTLSEDEILKSLKIITDQKLSVRETEQLVKRFGVQPARDDDLLDRLKTATDASNVELTGNAVTLSFETKERLESFIDSLL